MTIPLLTLEYVDAILLYLTSKICSLAYIVYIQSAAL